MSTETAFSRWLREEMPRRGYPVGTPRAGGISRLAKDAGISLANMSRMVSGSQEPSLDTLRKLGAVLGYELPQMMAFAGLAEYTRVPAPPQEPQRAAPFQVIDGDLQHTPTLTPEQVLYDQIAAYERGEADEPEQPPGGFDPRYLDSEQRIWRMRSFSLIRRWEIIKGMRQADEESAEEERRKAAQRRNDQPREA